MILLTIGHSITLQIVIAILMAISWYVGHWMAKSERDMVIGYREAEIARLQSRNEYLDKLIETLYGENAMKNAYNSGFIEGINKASRPEHEVQKFKDWLDTNYKGVEQPIPDIIGPAVTEPEDDIEYTDRSWDINYRPDHKLTSEQLYELDKRTPGSHQP